MNTMDHLEALLTEDRCKIRVKRRLRTIPLGDMFDAIFGDRSKLGPTHAWYVGGWGGKEWHWCQCSNQRVAVHFAHAVSKRAHANASATGLWEPVKAINEIAREWQAAATQVEVAA